MTLREALADAAMALPGVQQSQDGDRIEWSAGGRPFATFSDGAAEFRLQPLVGRAALGTPDTATSRRGREWIAFRPADVDRYAVDRATSWLASAHRHATSPRN